MEMAWNALEKKSPHSNHESRQESFEQHRERMRIFRRSHDFAEHIKHQKAPSSYPAKIKPVAPESYKLLSTLLIIGYVLNLIQEQSTVLLPKNWQN